MTRHSHRPKALKHLPRRQFLQIAQRAIENVTIAPILITIRILPDSLERPPARAGPRRAAVSRQHKRALGTERLAVARARRPPIIRAVDEWVARRFTVVGVHEVGDPVHHRHISSIQNPNRLQDRPFLGYPIIKGHWRK